LIEINTDKLFKLNILFSNRVQHTYPEDINAVHSQNCTSKFIKSHVIDKEDFFNHEQKDVLMSVVILRYINNIQVFKTMINQPSLVGFKGFPTYRMLLRALRVLRDKRVLYTDCIKRDFGMPVRVTLSQHFGDLWQVSELDEYLRRIDTSYKYVNSKRELYTYLRRTVKMSHFVANNVCMDLKHSDIFYFDDDYTYAPKDPCAVEVLNGLLNKKPEEKISQKDYDRYLKEISFKHDTSFQHSELTTISYFLSIVKIHILLNDMQFLLKDMHKILLDQGGK